MTRPVLHASPRVVALVAAVWGGVIAATTQITMPSWAHTVIATAGTVLAALGLVPEYEAPPAASPPPPAGEVWP